VVHTSITGQIDTIIAFARAGNLRISDMHAWMDAIRDGWMDGWMDGRKPSLVDFSDE